NGESVEKFNEYLEYCLYKDVLEKIDYEGFSNELKELRKEINKNIGEEDYKHLLKMQRWGRICSFLGYATSWIAPNPISPILISQGNVTRWGLVLHPISHKGYDKVPNIPPKYTSKVFARGYRRYIDWIDWIYPEAWDNEHNLLHHYHTGEALDPDLAERNIAVIRDANIPKFFKYILLFIFISTWKLVYYAPNTLAILQKIEKSNNKVKRNQLGYEVYDHTIYGSLSLLLPFSKDGIDFMKRCFLPYFIPRFVILPLLFLPISKFAAISVLINTIIAEIMTNIYSFVIIGPNHTGEDLYRFDCKVSDSAEFFVRQVSGSVNYKTGGDFNDFLHGWLNYQIEHHI
ncbi:MAG: fatty acid desaturase family protein, partial [Candidatus Sericytochromatia bacterium]